MEKKEFAPEVAAWTKKDKNGKEYLSIKLVDGSWINLFKNNYKKSDKAPDWVQAKPKTDQPPKLEDENVPF